MKENKYDEEQFFLKYGGMERSKKGLRGAGEWGEFQKLMPDFRGKSVLDLGCGYGWHCGYAAGNGARYVLGVDILHRMLETAKNSTRPRRRNTGAPRWKTLRSASVAST